MPVYEYGCEKCGAKFEKLVRTMSESGAPACPECGSAKTSRAPSVFAAVGGGGTRAELPPPMCGRCGGAPGSCGQ